MDDASSRGLVSRSEVDKILKIWKELKLIFW